VLHQLMEEVTTDARLGVWLASNRRPRHLVVRCPEALIEGVVRQITHGASAPVRFCALPGALYLPFDRRGTLLLFDAARLQLDQQISLFDWLGSQTGNIRVVALTTERIDRLVESGLFLEGLFHRLGSVQLHLTCSDSGDPSTEPCSRSRHVSKRHSSAKKVVCIGRMWLEG
jgi:hypothetical protein